MSEQPVERGPQGPPGPPGVAAPLRWLPAVGYVLLALVLGFLIFRVQTNCTDPRGDRAIRHQWERVADLIEAQSLKPGQPGYLTPEQIRQGFIDSYREAIEEAGPSPDCRGLF